MRPVGLPGGYLKNQQKPHQSTSSLLRGWGWRCGLCWGGSLETRLKWCVMKVRDSLRHKKHGKIHMEHNNGGLVQMIFLPNGGFLGAKAVYFQISHWLFPHSFVDGKWHQAPHDCPKMELGVCNFSLLGKRLPTGRIWGLMVVFPTGGRKVREIQTRDLHLEGLHVVDILHLFNEIWVFQLSKPKVNENFMVHVCFFSEPERKIPQQIHRSHSAE